MHGPNRTSFVLALALLVAPPGVGAQPSPAQPAEAWLTLERVRDRLAEQPQSADFVQTYLPVGFSSGERETGRLALALPDCLRWDYRIPYPKSFLLCGETVYSWNEGETSGRQQRIDAGDQPGLDLLRLIIDRLQQRYEAALEAAGDGQVEVILTPRDRGGEIANARFRIDPAPARLVGLSYRDAEGNLTRFEISGYRPLTSRQLFTPPDEIDWIED
ncbi:MAG: outer membrane lipoprotein carrier protein LolA [Thermoanaerobaculia bacterium]